MIQYIILPLAGYFGLKLFEEQSEEELPVYVPIAVVGLSLIHI